MRFSGLSVLLAPLALAACLSTTEPTSYATVEGTTFASSLGVDLIASTKTADGVYYRDLTQGTGATITATDSVGINYVGYLSTGTIFQSLQAGDPSSPFVFRLGAPYPGGAIPGLEEGMVGMKVGGSRQILIPPALAYGLQGVIDPNNVVIIPGNTVIVFVVDAVAVY